MLACPRCRHENSEGANFCEQCGLSFGSAVRATERRKTVTVLFCDLAGSTTLGESLDPERLRDLLGRYYDRMRAIVEQHGGSVEKFIGDAVMAVFGVPRVREDDALRALRAAAEMREALPGLGLQGRIGVTTGEVVTGTDEHLATGDAVNVAARLEQAAQPGEVLIGRPTLALLREAVEVEAVEPLELKGKAEPVPAYRLLRVRDVPERRHDARFVGRERELALVREAWERTRAERRCELFTVIGDAGIGKSRLAAEFLTSIDATVVRGRCLPYGEGITYWPVVEVLKQLGTLPPDEAAAEAIRSLLGDTESAPDAEEIAWAFRKTLEHAAAERPLVVLFDDVQWGEEAFRELIEHVALLSTGAALLLLCIARPELAERHPTWPVTLRLEPLGADDVDELIPERIGRGLRKQIARAAGGNPLFVEEIVAMAGDADDVVVVPPTLQALLSARLDQLEPAERSVLERGSIEGEIFHRGAVQALSLDGKHVTPRLAALVRKGLIRPDGSVVAGDDAFRFRHLLIRDAAYEALPKSVRADFHVRFASWLEEHATALIELDELAGYHLEQACRYRTELGEPADDELASAARTRLASGARRAARRQDYDAAANLLERTAALVPAYDLALESELRAVLNAAGRGDDALRRADVLSERAAAAGDDVGELCGRIHDGLSRLSLEHEGATEMLAALVEEALPVLEAADENVALYIGYSAAGEVATAQGHPDAALQAYERAFGHARKAGHQPSWGVGVLAYCRFAGTTPLSELLAWLDALAPRAGHYPFFRAYRAWSLAKLGRIVESRAILAEVRAEQSERGGGPVLANITAVLSGVELLAGDAATAAELGAEGCRLHEELGDRGFLAAGNLAQALYALGRLEESDEWAGRVASLSVNDDRWAHMLWRQVRGKVLARRGEHAEAKRLAREAVNIGDGTDLLDMQGDAYADLAEVLLLAGGPDEATAALEQALERYERKENLVMAARTRERIAALAEPTTTA